MLDFLYTLIVLPLRMVLEFLFDNIYDISGDIGLTIFVMSFIISIICLPLYLKADLIQEEENEIQNKLRGRVEAIKRNYKGDERHLLLQTYYRQNNYHPIMGLRLALSLLLQIPIFMAAYMFFSNLSILNGMSYGVLDNLTRPDGLLKLGGVDINILPIMMTVVNLLAGFVYSKDKRLGANRALILMSIVFLVLLYNSPSALVLYWLFNNVFSLLKNICLIEIPHKRLTRYSVITALIVYCLFVFVYNISGLFLFFVLIFWGLKRSGKLDKFNLDISLAGDKLFFMSLVALCVLLGGIIPSNIIVPSPSEFVFFDVTPIQLLQNTFFVFVGVALWVVCVYYLSNKKIKNILSLGMCLFLFYSLINLLMQKMPMVTLSNIFTFETSLVFFNPFFNIPNLLRTLVIIFVLGLTLFFVLKKKIDFVYKGVFLILVSSIVLSIYNGVLIFNKTKSITDTLVQPMSFDEKYINLSKSNKNVLVIFVDRAINSYLPIIFKEHPYLYKQFEGFVYYPNTLSYSGYTLLGYLPILGGYEYTPFRMDERAGVFEKKFNEAITMLPAIFSKQGWKSTVINPMGEGWEGTSGLTKEQRDILANNELCDKYNIAQKTIPYSISSEFQQRVKLVRGALAKRNCVYYSLLSVSSPSVRNYLYENGRYHNPESDVRGAFSKDFLKSYSEFYYLSKLTSFSGKGNTFTVFNNSLPHNPTRLNYPNYDISDTNQADYPCPIRINDNTWSLRHYHVNVAMFKMLGNYLDYLRENNVFENTRIIIVADHGFGYNLKNPFMGQFEADNYLPYNPLLMVKDFGSSGDLETVDDIMTNADVPEIATKGLVANPINPYTNKRLLSEDKQKGILIKDDVKWQPVHYLGKENVLVQKDKFLFVKGHPLEHNNWKLNLSYEEALKLSK